MVAAATVDAIAHGDIAPPELNIAHTPRTGVALTHRLLVLLPRPQQAPPAAGPRDARRAAEPTLEPWLRQLLGEPRDVASGSSSSTATQSCTPKTTCGWLRRGFPTSTPST